MGMFDYITIKAEIFEPELNGHTFQTKCTPAQSLDQYELREDLTLWHEDYELEDRSDPNAEGIARIVGIATRVNKKWVPCTYTGTMNFYDLIGKDKWVEFEALFKDGELITVGLLPDRGAGTEAG